MLGDSPSLQEDGEKVHVTHEGFCTRWPAGGSTHLSKLNSWLTFEPGHGKRTPLRESEDPGERSELKPTGGVCGRVGDLGAAVAVGGGLGVGVDLDGLELLGNPCSCRDTEVIRPSNRSSSSGSVCVCGVGGSAAVRAGQTSLVTPRSRNSRKVSDSSPSSSCSFSVMTTVG